MTRFPALLVTLLLLAQPLAVTAESIPAPLTAAGFQSNGIFGCNRAGADAISSAGSTGAIGSSFVPVSDAAVELNTGLLAYKECVLRNIVDREKETATAALVDKNVTLLNTGRNGNPLFPVNLGQDLQDVSDQTAARFFQSGVLDSLNPAFRSTVSTALARNYYQSTRAPQLSLACSYQGDWGAFARGDTFSWAALRAASDPACDPVYAYTLAQEQLSAARAQERELTLAQLSYNGGLYSVSRTGPNGIAEVTTPGSLVGAILGRSILSGFNQLENANDIGQMVGALFAGLATQAIYDQGGLRGLTQASGGQPSYLAQLGMESQARLASSVTNAALGILSSAQQNEQAYYQAVNGIATTLTQTASQLRGAENQCWGLIVPKVKDYAQEKHLTLTIATSTVFSQAVIDAQITPLASTTARNVDSSFQALQKINDLIVQVQSSTSTATDAQQAALRQLNSLVAAGALHSQSDVIIARQNETDAQTAMTGLLQQTVKTWGDGVPNPSNLFDPNSGWCNVNSDDDIVLWATKWSHPVPTP